MADRPGCQWRELRCPDGYFTALARSPGRESAGRGRRFGTLTLNGNNVKAQGFNLTTGTATGMNDAASAIPG
ncbi:MAG: hypothetical protein R3F44_19350 [Candidatus Competibacteraceae bacterium]